MMRRTRPWACRWALGWSKVLANGSSNNGSRGSGCAGVRTVSTISCPSGSLGSTDALMLCSTWTCPRTHKCAYLNILRWHHDCGAQPQLTLSRPSPRRPISLRLWKTRTSCRSDMTQARTSSERSLATGFRWNCPSTSLRDWRKSFAVWTTSIFSDADVLVTSASPYPLRDAQNALRADSKRGSSGSFSTAPCQG